MKRKRKKSANLKEIEEHAPIYLRYKQVQAERDGYQQALKELHQKRTSGAFKPKINEISKKIMQKNDSNNVVKRLIQKGKEIEERKQKLALEKEKREKKMRQWKTDNIGIMKNTDFFERQKEFLKKKEDKMRELKQETKGDFKPRINLVSKVLAEELREETGGDFKRWENRLGDLEVRKGHIRREERKAKRKKEEGTFHPKINLISKKVAKRKTFSELTDTSKREAKLREKREMKIKQELDGCSFKPKINNQRGKSQVKKSIEERIKDWEERKRLKLEIGKREQEQKEMGKYQFKPKLHHKPGTIPKEVQKEKMLSNIKGLSKFLENKEMGFRKQEEKEQAYQDAFGKWGKGFTVETTVPEPFRLKSHNRRVKKDEIKEDNRVFKPVTKNLIYQEVLDKFEDTFAD